MKKLILALLAALAIGSAPAAAADRIQVGILSCDVDPTIGLILGSITDLDCTFERSGHGDEHYTGTVRKFGLDLGITAKTKIVWLVFAAATTKMNDRALAGTYIGGSSEATLGVGLGSNWLIGGSRRGFALQPWSVQAQVGLSLAVTLTSLELD